MDEKRKKTRIRANAIVTFKVKTTRLVGGSRIKDISETGICIPSKHYFPVDSILEMEIRSDDLSDPIKTLAKVVRVTNRNKVKYPFEVGIVFLDLPASRQNVLHDYINHAIAQGVEQDISWLD